MKMDQNSNHENARNNTNTQELRIKAEKVNLRSCSLDFVTKDTAPAEDLTHELSVAVLGKILAAELSVVLLNNIPDNNDFAQLLSFKLVGLFTADEGLSEEQIADFGQKYTLSIIWPYAREFAQYMFQRTGFQSECLPIINAQEVTKEMIEKGSIKVQIFPKAGQ